MRGKTPTAQLKRIGEEDDDYDDDLFEIRVLSTAECKIK